VVPSGSRLGRCLPLIHLKDLVRANKSGLNCYVNETLARLGCGAASVVKWPTAPVRTTSNCLPQSKRWPAPGEHDCGTPVVPGQPQWWVKRLFTFIQFGWNESPTCASWSRRELRGKQEVAGKEYLTRQAATLLKLARSTKDPQIAAGLVEKAADLKSQVDSAPDRSPHAPDVEV